MNILNIAFRKELPKKYMGKLQNLCELLDSITQHHNTFLRSIENRLILWESRSAAEERRIGDIMLKSLSILPVYDEFAQSHLTMMQCLNNIFIQNKNFREEYKQFEQTEICYLPIGELLIRPLYRILHYQLIFKRNFFVYTLRYYFSCLCRAMRMLHIK